MVAAAVRLTAAVAVLNVQVVLVAVAAAVAQRGVRGGVHYVVIAERIAVAQRIVALIEQLRLAGRRVAVLTVLAIIDHIVLCDKDELFIVVHIGVILNHRLVGFVEVSVRLCGGFERSCDAVEAAGGESELTMNRKECTQKRMNRRRW